MRDSDFKSMDNAYYDDEIDLAEILNKIREKKYLVIITSLVFIILSYLFIIFYYPKIIETSSIVSLNFKGIEKHENPDKSIFEEEQLISPSILNQVYLEIGLGENVELSDLRKSIDIDPYIPQEIKDKLKDSKDKIEYFPNYFYINLKSEKKDIFSGETREKIIKSIVHNYRLNFIEKYLRTESVSIDFEEEFYKDNDFSDLIGILEKNLANLIEFSSEKIENEGNFYSSNLKTDFGLIKKRLEIIKDNDLKNIDSLVSVRNITKFKQLHVDKLEYQIKEFSLKRKTKEMEYKGVEQLLEKVGPGGKIKGRSGSAANLNIDEDFINNLIEKDYYSFLVKKASKISSELSSLVVLENDLINKRKELIQDKNGRSKDLGLIQNKIENIGKNIEKYSLILTKLNNEQMENKFENLIQIIRPPETEVYRGVNIKLVLILSLLSGIFTGIFLVFILNIFKKGEPESVGQDESEIQFRVLRREENEKIK